VRNLSLIGVLQVEARKSGDDTFGQGIKKRMTFAAFLDLLEKSDNLHYLTTQRKKLLTP